jgi:DNA-binding MarR family transcriptional regulator
VSPPLRQAKGLRHKPLLNVEERTVWRTFLRLHAGLTRRLDDELRASLGLSLSAFEVLWVLTTEPENRIRMTELADHLVFTRSGVTRLIDRLERDGLVVRGEVGEDLRGRYAILTREGFDLFEEAAAAYVDKLRELFFAPLRGRPLGELGTLLCRIDEGLVEADAS